ncbi:MAG TPA: hypothetical protein VKU44_06440 [Terriglobia bacterium]|nr:hypothetical protein [Terriglobia bacterium]
MKTASWIILLIVGALTLLGSLVSLGRAYVSAQDEIGPASLSELAAGRPEVATAVRARRATSAAYAAGFATLFLAILLGPYRRGDVWAWWTLLAGTLAVTVLTLLRLAFLDTRLGVPAAAIQLVVAGLGLALGTGRLGRSTPPA